MDDPLQDLFSKADGLLMENKFIISPEMDDLLDRAARARSWRKRRKLLEFDILVRKHHKNTAQIEDLLGEIHADTLRRLRGGA